MAGGRNRQKAERRGRLAETAAAWRLPLTGHQVLARRFKCHAGEIDLIARRGRYLIFAEVKARPSAAKAAEAVTMDQRRRIARAAEAFVQSMPELAGLDWRFDLIQVASPLGLRHLKDAWRPDLP